VAERELPDGHAEQLGSGLRTFCSRPFVSDLEQLRRWKPDVAIVGAPYDLGVTNRPGARFGPNAIRTQSYESGTYHLTHGLEIYDWLEVVDAGDIWCPHGQPERGHANIKERIANIVGLGIVPVVIGGDHSITWPVATAVADHLGYGTVGMVHFDAHADTADTIEGNLASHGTPMRRLVESGAIRPTNFVQIGLRSHWPGADVWDWMRAQSMHWHLMDDVVTQGLPAVLDTAIGQALDGCDALYLSIDIDVLDPAFAPGTGTPEPGGLNTAELLRAVRRVVSECNVVCMDICEVAPAYDHADVTVNAAHHLVVEALAAWAARRRDLAADSADSRPGHP
jgi:agmatinase